MKPLGILFFVISAVALSCNAQVNKNNVSAGMSAVASKFLETLSPEQKSKTRFSFDDQERYDWHYIPKPRKGISLGELNDQQKKAAFDLLRSALSDTGYKK